MTELSSAVIPVYVVLPPRTLLLDVAGPMEVLRRAAMEPGAPGFSVSYLAVRATMDSSIGLGLAGLRPLPDAVPDGALVIVSGNVDQVLGGAGPTARDVEDEAAIVAWLARVVRPGVTLACICSGALLAARAGLLAGKACTTHHVCTAELARLAPSARVLEDRLFVEDGERLTSAGITSGVDLMLHLVARLRGPALAVSIARAMVVYLRRGPSDPQLSPWLEGRNHVHPAVHRVQDAIAAEPARDWSLEMLADLAAASPRHLSRLFNAHAGMSLTDYVNRLRLALASEMLAATRLDMESVAERAGFASTRQLRRVWRRHHPTPPKAARAAG
ncbi:AraC family transcriptional regulator [Caulobacter flavus]|uniref:AraC family transcriptional regulator n=1 Tax=Caulobacter flavus TaxID=1679497 RepID=A0A2N5CNE6_9CAUL|nr:helix-turn-helix domain-containing protein [Caulobacter flavus]AYV46712.1 AraC family transcriptional regulator [Caulobacter flavus]PLR07949.1 AraC family transcriptional regulator [Caulobacter flavus]